MTWLLVDVWCSNNNIQHTERNQQNQIIRSIHLILNNFFRKRFTYFIESQERLSECKLMFVAINCFYFFFIFISIKGSLDSFRWWEFSELRQRGDHQYFENYDSWFVLVFLIRYKLRKNWIFPKIYICCDEDLNSKTSWFVALLSDCVTRWISTLQRSQSTDTFELVLRFLIRLVLTFNRCQRSRIIL